MLKNILIFGVGAATGSLLCAYILKAKYEDEIAKEIKSLHEWAARRQKKDKEDTDETAAIFDGRDEKSEEVVVTKTDISDAKKTPTVFYNKQFKSSDLESATLQQISEDEYQSDELVQGMAPEKTEVWFYGKDLTLCYEDDSLVDKNKFNWPIFEAIITENFPSGFGNMADHQRYLYLRDFKTKIDYEVEIMANNSYQEDVLGIFPEGAFGNTYDDDGEDDDM